MTSPDRDDLDQAYAQAHALTDDGRGPAPSVRANVLAAALQVAAQARADVQPEVKPTLVPVAAPVADVARGRLWALNLSSWRVRSGAALCAALVVGLGMWRFESSRMGPDLQVASAEYRVTESKVVDAPPRDLPPPPKNLPMPGRSTSPAYASVPPAPVLADQAVEAKAEARATRDKDLVVAEAEQPYRANSAAPARAADRGLFEAAAKPAGRLADADAARAVAQDAVRAAPTTTYAIAPPPAAVPGEQRIALAPPPAAAAAPAAVAFAPPAAPAPVAAASSTGNVVVAAADPRQRAEIAGGSIARESGGVAARGALEKAKAAPMLADKRAAVSPRLLPTALHVAAGDNDIDALQKLLANPATRVDATDAQGRTPLLLAVAAQHVAAVRLLLAAGADPDRADSTGATPRSVARTGANAEIATLLGTSR